MESRVPDKKVPGSWTHDRTLEVNQTSREIYFIYLKSSDCSHFESMSSRHLSPFEDSSWVLSLSDGSDRSMGTVSSMWSRLSSHIKVRNCWHETFSFGLSSHINKLTNSKVSNSQTVTNWKEILPINFELLDSPFRTQMVLQVPSNLLSLNPIEILLTSSNHQSIIAIPFLSLMTENLTSINHQNSQRLISTPFIINSSHPNLLSNHPGSNGSLRNTLPLLNLILFIDNPFGIKSRQHFLNLIPVFSIETFDGQIFKNFSFLLFPL